MTTIILALIFLLLSALFSGSEIGYISANKLKVEIKTSESSRKARVFKAFFNNPQEFIASMLVGNNIALVIFTYLVTELMRRFFGHWFSSEFLFLLATTVLITIVVLIFGEYLPKIFFRIFNVEMLYKLTYPLHFIRKMLAIPTWITVKLSEMVLRRFYGEQDEIKENFLTRTELEQFIKTSTYEEDDSVDTEMLQRALEMKETKVRECMVPRPEIVSIEVNEGIEALREAFASSMLSKVIVFEDELDNVVGYVHHRQMLEEPSDIRSILMKIKLIPEVTPVKKLMKSFIREGTSIAAVVDEFGGLSGIITLEDILEELFGEIEDEYDEEEELEKLINEHEFVFSGRLEIDYLNDKYDQLELPEGDYNTLSGYVIQELQEIPEEGQVLETEQYKFAIESVSEKKIESIRLSIKEQEDKKS